LAVGGSTCWSDWTDRGGFNCSGSNRADWSCFNRCRTDRTNGRSLDGSRTDRANWTFGRGFNGCGANGANGGCWRNWSVRIWRVDNGGNDANDDRANDYFEYLC
jgi:hypothetical protein